MRRDDLDRREGGMSSGLMMLIAAVVVFGLLFMWAPWSGPRVADNTAPGNTVGSSAATIGSDGSEHCSSPHYTHHTGQPFDNSLTPNR